MPNGTTPTGSRRGGSGSEEERSGIRDKEKEIQLPCFQHPDSLSVPPKTSRLNHTGKVYYLSKNSLPFQLHLISTSSLSYIYSTKKAIVLLMIQSSPNPYVLWILCQSGLIIL